jgi:hypothetical protein
VSGASFSWVNNNPSIGLPASGTGNIPSFTAQNNTNQSNPAIITVTPKAQGCPGQPFDINITALPIPDAVANPQTQVVCNNTLTSAIGFSSSVPGTTFDWTNNNPSIGLGASGSGDIPSFLAINNTNMPVSAAITVTPSANGCPGTPIQAFITASNLVSNVVASPNMQTVCANSPTSAISFTGGTPGAIYNWTNDQPSIGLPASGTGDIGSLVALNGGSIPVVAKITITPAANGCAYNPVNAFIMVNPVATVDAIANQVVCVHSSTTAVTCSSSTPGVTFTWTNSTPSIGLPASGTGNIPAFTVLNSGVAVIVVTPVVGGCAGIPRSFLIVAL